MTIWVPVLAIERHPTQVEGAINVRHDAVLAVSGDRRLTTRVAGLLEAGGAVVMTCRDAEEAAPRIAEARPDLVVLDAPPGDSALSLLRRLRDDPATDAVPVLVLANEDDRETCLRAFELGPTMSPAVA